MNDLIGNAHMSLGFNTTFVEDRFGMPNSALALNGGWTQVPSGIYFDSSQFTATAWVYPSQLGKYSRVFDFGNGQYSNNIGLAFCSNFLNSNPIAEIYNGSLLALPRVLSSKSLNLDAWQFLALTFNGSILSLFINGSLAGSSSMPNGETFQLPHLNRARNFFGKSNWPIDGYSSSFLDDIRFYSISLTQTQINDLMNDDVSNSFSACPFISTTTTSSSTTSTITTTTTSLDTETSLGTSIPFTTQVQYSTSTLNPCILAHSRNSLFSDNLPNYKQINYL